MAFSQRMRRCVEHMETFPENEQCPGCHPPEQAMTAQECPVQAQAEGRPLLKANERQVGGAHYGKVQYQHWDFVTDVNLHYLVGCASKYVTRHREKNGTQDLEKALHYLQKAEERDVEAMTSKREHFEAVINFAAQLPELERRAVESMCMSNYSMAAAFVRELLAA